MSKPDFGSYKNSPGRKLWNNGVGTPTKKSAEDYHGLPGQNSMVPAGTSSNRGGSKSRDQDLFTSMASRLTKLEQLNQSLRLEVKEKTIQVRCLEDENTSLKMVADKSMLKEVKHLRIQRDEYKKQCGEMERFLADYGLNWIGNDGTG